MVSFLIAYIRELDTLFSIMDSWLYLPIYRERVSNIELVPYKHIAQSKYLTWLRSNRLSIGADILYSIKL